MPEKITLEVCKDGWTGGLQLSINKVDEEGRGGGYRLAGPKFNGSSKLLLQTALDQRDADEIRAHLDAVFPVKPANDAAAEEAGAAPNDPVTDTPRHPLAQIARECGITTADVRKTLIADSYEYHDRATRLIAAARTSRELDEEKRDTLDAHSAATAYAYLLAALLRIVGDRHGEDEALGMACMVDAVRESGTDVLEDANHDIDERANEVAR
jgi:hypothetical protein